MCVAAATYGCLPNRLPVRFFYFVIALFNFYGLMLSGSRGPVAIIGIGGIVFLMMARRSRLWSLPEGRIRQILLGFYAGYCGLILSSYVNETMTQVPMSIICYAVPALIIVAEYWYKTGVDIEDPPSAPRPPLY